MWPPCEFSKTKRNSKRRLSRHPRTRFNFLQIVTEAAWTRTSRSSPRRRSNSRTNETPLISSAVDWTQVFFSSRHWGEAGTHPIFRLSVHPRFGTIEDRLSVYDRSHARGSSLKSNGLACTQFVST